MRRRRPPIPLRLAPSRTSKLSINLGGLQRGHALRSGRNRHRRLARVEPIPPLECWIRRLPAAKQQVPQKYELGRRVLDLLELGTCPLFGGIVFAHTAQPLTLTAGGSDLTPTSSPIARIAIRTLYEAISCDEINAIKSVVFNGWVDYIDGATGQARQAYIVSVHAPKPQITELNIAHVNPFECFRSLKGLAAARISAYTPVAPLLTFDKKDDRLVEGRKIIEGLSAGDNLAAMDWDDFEHLIRELFEKVFSAPGVDVRITRASRDRGVDAIIYDPDSIRGGRYIIQAKKYTNLVDVAAVRDLFGTVQAEKANRGILVTTSHFGPDAHEFAKTRTLLS